MCGISFYCDDAFSKLDLSNRIERSVTALKHRGPDAHNVICKQNWGVGHTRLSIIDLSESHQPMSEPSQRYYLTYNGEIYNYKELREKLKTRWNFKTSGDTEVLLAGLILEGKSFVSQLEGMWAFVFWDSLKEEAWICRDRMGKKPVYYRATSQFLYCASELPAFFQLYPYDKREDVKSTNDYFNFGYCLPGFTNYEKIFEVLPGQISTWEKGKGIKHRSYWSLNYLDEVDYNLTQLNDLIRARLVEAVEKRLVADVEVGCLLSGGIDSSLITCIASKELNKPLKTFTIGFEESAYDEREYARTVAEFCKTDHYLDVVSNTDIDKLISLLNNHIGQPFADSSLLPTAAVANLASKHLKVVLSGDGGDELFSGYARYKANFLFKWYSRLPEVIKTNFSKYVRYLPDNDKHHSRSIMRQLHLFCEMAESRKSDRDYVGPKFWSPNELGRLLGDKRQGHECQVIPKEVELDSVKQMMVADAQVYLPQDILVKLDRSLMAYSVEGRAPFLDSALVELAFCLPISAHRKLFEGKLLLKQQLTKYLPRKFVNRRKQGFGVPVHAWFRTGLEKRVLELIKYDSFLNRNEVERLVKEHVSGKREHGYRLWLLLSYLNWKTNL